MESWRQAIAEGGSWGSVFEHDVLLAAEFSALFRDARPLTRERLLMLAVLEDGLACFSKHAGARQPRARRLFAEARDWLESTERTHLFAFESICEALELDPSWVRRLARRGLERAAPKSPRRRGPRRPLAA